MSRRLPYLPFLLTGDPYHLETMQFQVTFNLLERPAKYRYFTGQVRAHAWSLRTLAQAATVVPDTTPRWLLPRSYFRTLLGKQHDWMIAAFVNNTASPTATVFRTNEETFGSRDDGAMQAGTITAPWQDEFEAFILGWVVQMGHADWEPYSAGRSAQGLHGPTARAGGCGRCTPYRMVPRAPQLALGAILERGWQLNETRQDRQFADPNRLELTKAGSSLTPATPAPPSP